MAFEDGRHLGYGTSRDQQPRHARWSGSAVYLAVNSELQCAVRTLLMTPLLVERSINGHSAAIHLQGHECGLTLTWYRSCELNRELKTEMSLKCLHVYFYCAMNPMALDHCTPSSTDRLIKNCSELRTSNCGKSSSMTTTEWIYSAGYCAIWTVVKLLAILQSYCELLLLNAE
ncbi:hypothetical protein NEUTE2DRAFT_157710 [Neurospora tetrasperma FGSC 2509]|nr:hypothetical protein NEUTE2DRAFT_157710 [Neurospora tetrasperma FGSC 2509]